MADELKYKKGDTIFNLDGEHIGTIVKGEKPEDNGKKNKYEIEMVDGSPNVVLDENYIHETEYHKKKDK